MKKLALCALVLGAGLAASRADVSLGIRIGIDDRHDHYASHRSSHTHNHYRVQHRTFVPPPAVVVRCEPVIVTCPICGRPESRGAYQQPAAWRPATVCADRKTYVAAVPAWPPRGHGW